MAITDRHGLPISIGIEGGQRHEVGLVDAALESCFFDEVPETLVGDKAYDSRLLRESLQRERGVRLISPARRTTRRKTDGRRMRRYRRRWVVERLFSWLQNFRRLNVRWEHKAENFLGFLHLACLKILLKRL